MQRAGGVGRSMDGKEVAREGTSGPQTRRYQYLWLGVDRVERTARLFLRGWFGSRTIVVAVVAVVAVEVCRLWVPD